MQQVFNQVALGLIRPSPYNSRDEASYQKADPDFVRLMESIRDKGVVEPIIVRVVSVDDGPLDDLDAFCESVFSSAGVDLRVCSADDLDALSSRGVIGYELVAGERRWRASCRNAEENGGLDGKVIPAIVRLLNDEDSFDLTTIENLDRKDLNPLEEARGFFKWAQRRGKAALKELALRTGIKQDYINKRVALMEMPADVLEAWGRGVLKFGHLEQMLRLGGGPRVMEYFDRITRYGNVPPVATFKTMIDNDRPPLRKARFDKRECDNCHKNSTIQQELFGDDLAGKEGFCLDSDCYREKQREAIERTWEKSRHKRDQGTTNWRFRDEVAWVDFESITGAPFVECRNCDKYISLLNLDGSMNIGRACYRDKVCFAKVVRKSKGLGGSAASSANAARRRASEHGRLFREEFFKETIPARVERLQPDDLAVRQLTLYSLLLSNSALLEDFKAAHFEPDNNKEREWLSDYWHIKNRDVFECIEAMDADQAAAEIKAATVNVITQKSQLSEVRLLSGRRLGIDLGTEWVISEEYLKKKQIKELLELGEDLGVFADEAAQAFLYEKLNKKRGRFDTCGKGELIRVFLESGVDLAGRVPVEILDVDGDLDDE